MHNEASFKLSMWCILNMACMWVQVIGVASKIVAFVSLLKHKNEASFRHRLLVL